MAEPIERRWVGEALVVRLRDAEGLLGMARETRLRLTPARLQLRGRRLGGLRMDLPLEGIEAVTVQLVPAPTLVLRSRRGRIEVPAGAHDIGDLQILAEEIQEAARVARQVLREQHEGEGAEAIARLRRRIDD